MTTGTYISVTGGVVMFLSAAAAGLGAGAVAGPFFVLGLLLIALGFLVDWIIGMIAKS